MNSIQPIQHQQFTQSTTAGSLRKAATSTDMPKLTQDEADLIKQQFQTDNRLSYYSDKGQVNEQLFSRGMNLDTKA